MSDEKSGKTAGKHHPCGAVRFALASAPHAASHSRFRLAGRIDQARLVPELERLAVGKRDGVPDGARVVGTFEAEARAHRAGDVQQDQAIAQETWPQPSTGPLAFALNKFGL